nr:basic proline-rich protein-like [Aegilops tauschii subsp. strangulata]
MSSPRRAARSPIPGRPPRDAVSARSAAAVAGSRSPRADSRPHPSGVTAAGSARLGTVRRAARRFSFARRPPALAGSRPHPGLPRAPLPRSGGAPTPPPATRAWPGPAPRLCSPSLRHPAPPCGRLRASACLRRLLHTPGPGRLRVASAGGRLRPVPRRPVAGSYSPHGRLPARPGRLLRVRPPSVASAWPGPAPRLCSPSLRHPAPPCGRLRASACLRRLLHTPGPPPPPPPRPALWPAPRLCVPAPAPPHARPGPASGRQRRRPASPRSAPAVRAARWPAPTRRAAGSPRVLADSCASGPPSSPPPGRVVRARPVSAPRARLSRAGSGLCPAGRWPPTSGLAPTPAGLPLQPAAGFRLLPGLPAAPPAPHPAGVRNNKGRMKRQENMGSARNVARYITRGGVTLVIIVFISNVATAGDALDAIVHHVAFVCGDHHPVIF